MTLISGIDLPGKRLHVRAGYDGWEPVEIAEKGRALAEEHVRLAVVINTDYSPILMDNYVNYALVGLVQDALAAMGIAIAHDYLCNGEGLIPKEERCALSCQKSYYLVKEPVEVQGGLILWETLYSWFGPFYGEDALVMDFTLRAKQAADLVVSIAKLCSENDVVFLESDAAACRPSDSISSRIMSIFRRGRSLGNRAAWK